MCQLAVGVKRSHFKRFELKVTMLALLHISVSSRFQCIGPRYVKLLGLKSSLRSEIDKSHRPDKWLPSWWLTILSSSDMTAGVSLFTFLHILFLVICIYYSPTFPIGLRLWLALNWSQTDENDLIQWIACHRTLALWVACLDVKISFFLTLDGVSTILPCTQNVMNLFGSQICSSLWNGRFAHHVMTWANSSRLATGTTTILGSSHQMAKIYQVSILSVYITYSHFVSCKKNTLTSQSGLHFPHNIETKQLQHTLMAFKFIVHIVDGIEQL